MRQAVLADTGPLYAAVDPRDAHHSRALRELQNFAVEKYEILVSFPTLIEVHALILLRFDPKIAFRWLREMEAAALVNPGAEDYQRAIARVQAFADQKITLFDAVAAAVAIRLQIQVWTYDHHFDVMRIPVWRTLDR